MKAVRIPFFILLGLLLGSYFTIPSVDYDKVEYYVNEPKTSSTLGYEAEEVQETNYVSVEIILNYDNFGVDEMIFDERHTRDQIKEHQRERRNEAKKYHYNNNERIAKMFQLKNYQELYISGYFPVIEVSYNLDYFEKHEQKILSSITNNKFVKRVNIIELYIPETYVLEAAHMSDAYEVYLDRTTTGDGVVVGVLESGVVDDDHVTLANTSVTTRFNVLNLLNSKEHATCMASIIAGSTGIAPGASILSCFWSGSMSEEAEWLIEHDVDIINMSCGTTDLNGVYGGDSIYVDYVALNYDIICVVSAGNYGTTNAYVINPGLSYNAITVGSMDYQGLVYDYSSYVTVDGPEKPTICTDGTLAWRISDDTVHAVEGTSSAAALCSGFIALVLEEYPELASKQCQLRALITACAERFEQYYVFPTDCGFDDRGGAGLLNYQNMIDNAINSATLLVYDATGNNRWYNQQIYLTAGQTVRFSVAWNAISNGEGAEVLITDYDAMIRNSNNEVVECANSVDSCVEVLSFTATQSGYYTLYVYNIEEQVYPVDKVGVAYRII